MKSTITMNDHTGNKTLVLAACLTAAVIPMSIAGPAIIIPAINSTLGGSIIELNWVTNAYMLTYGSATMAAGSVADIYGRKKTWLMGLLLFVLMTGAIPFMPSVFWIDILRLIQGIGAAGAFAGAMAALTQVFEGKMRIRVFSFIGTTFGGGATYQFSRLVMGIFHARTYCAIYLYHCHKIYQREP